MTLEFQYECTCSGYHAPTDQTMDHSGLDLLFDPAVSPTIRTNPVRPTEFTGFYIMWEYCYDQRDCVDPRGRSGDFPALVTIRRSGVLEDQFTVQVPSVDMDDCVRFEYWYADGLKQGSYTIEVRLNPGAYARECGFLDREPAVDDNNFAQGAFEVDPCYCPPSLGDLALRNLEAPEEMRPDSSVAVRWLACYDPICGSYEGETGPVSERVHIESLEVDWSRVYEFDEIDSIALGSCVERELWTPSDMPPGRCRITVTLDPGNLGPQCEHASTDNESSPIEVVVVER